MITCALASLHAGAYARCTPRSSLRSSYRADRPPRIERGALYLLRPSLMTLRCEPNRLPTPPPRGSESVNN